MSSTSLSIPCSQNNSNEIILPSLNESEKQGRKIYQTNKHYRALANVMEHPLFKDFLDNYILDLDYAKSMIMFMKLYDNIEKTSTIPLTGYQKLAIMDNILKNRGFRRQIVSDMIDDIKKIRG